MNPPAFSVIIPAFNRAHFLPRAIDSVLAQSLTDFELIVVDDGSTDESRKLIEAITDPRVKYVYQVNAGAAAARNNGATAAEGRCVTFLDSDDEATPTWLAEFADAFLARQAAVVCCGVIQASYAEGRTTETTVLPHDLGPMVGHQTGLFITGGTYALKQEVFDAIGGFAAELRAGQHTELSFRLIPYCKGNDLKIHSIARPLVRRHIHEGPSIRKDPRALLQGSLYFLEHHTDKLRRDRRTLADYWAVAGVASIRSGQFHRSRKYFKRAIQAYPWDWRHYVRFLPTLVPHIGKKILTRIYD
jgi:glycosyltransferase involved in cell wall biosynthesis